MKEFRISVKVLVLDTPTENITFSRTIKAESIFTVVQDLDSAIDGIHVPKEGADDRA